MESLVREAEKMTLNELIERLEGIREDLGNGDGEVFIASQPQYPLRNVVTTVSAEADWEDSDPHSDTVWIAVDQDGNQPYASGAAWVG